jgi:hypothetical protein
LTTIRNTQTFGPHPENDALIGRSYLKALETASKPGDAAGEYVGRAIMENIEQALQKRPGGRRAESVILERSGGTIT